MDSDELVWNVLSNMHGKCTSTEEARRISDKMVDQDVVSWTTMIFYVLSVDGILRLGIDQT